MSTYDVRTSAGRWYETDDLSDALDAMDRAEEAIGIRPWLVGPNGIIDTCRCAGSYHLLSDCEANRP